MRGCVTAVSVWGGVAVEGPGPVTGGGGKALPESHEWATWRRARVWRAMASPPGPPAIVVGEAEASQSVSLLADGEAVPVGWGESTRGSCDVILSHDKNAV